MLGSSEEQEESAGGKRRAGPATEGASGKILIEVSLSKQKMRDHEITQIIREILELDCQDVEVEKVVTPVGESTWQIRKASSPIEEGSSSVEFLAPDSVELVKKKRGRLQQSRSKLMKHSKVFRVKVPKSCHCRTTQCPRRRRRSEAFGLRDLDVAEVHSSPAITNLLSQLYPNPYKLIRLMEVEDSGKRPLSGGAPEEGKGCNVKFKATRCGRGTDAEEEVAPMESSKSSVTSTPTTVGSEAESSQDRERGVQAVVFGAAQDATYPFSFAGLRRACGKRTERAPCRRVKRMKMTFPEEAVRSVKNCAAKEVREAESKEGRASEKRKTNRVTEEVSASEVPQKFRTMSVEFKTSTKRTVKSRKPTTEKALEGKQCSPLSNRKTSRSSIHPTQVREAAVPSEKGRGEEEVSRSHSVTPGIVSPEGVKHSNRGEEARGGRGRAKQRKVERRRSVMRYLQLIKDMYEAEERQLQSKIDDALTFALDQIDKSEKKAGKTRAFRHGLGRQTPAKAEGKWRVGQSQTPKLRKCRRQEERLRGEAESGDRGVEPEVAAGVKVSGEDGAASEVHPGPTGGGAAEASCSWLREPRTYQVDVISKVRPNSRNGRSGGVREVLRTDTYFFSRRRGMRKGNMGEGLPIDVINSNVEETNRKIDLLIRHIDNSMDWLNQSERTSPSSISSLIEKAQDLSDKLESNLRLCRGRFVPFPREDCKRKFPAERSELLFDQAYRSLRILPGDNMLGSVRISANALLNRDLLSRRSRDYLWLHSDIIRPSPLGNAAIERGRMLLPNDGAGPCNGQARADATVAGNDREQSEERGRRAANQRHVTLQSEVPELPIAPATDLISVESSNELGSFTENVEVRECGSRWSCESLRRGKWDSKVALADVKTALDKEERLLSSERSICSVAVKKASPSSVSISVVAFDERSSVLRPVVVQEITWNFHLPVPAPALRVHFRNERSFVYTTMEASVLHVATATCFLELALMSAIHVVEHEPKQQTSVIISLHKCPSFVKNNEGLEVSSKVCKFVVLPTDVNFTAYSSGNLAISDEESASVDIKVLKQPESGALFARNENAIGDHPFQWDSFPSESSTEVYEIDKLKINKIESLLQRSKKLESKTNSRTLEWLHPLPDPLGSNPADRGAGVTRSINFHTMASSPAVSLLREGRKELLPETNPWDRRKVKFDGVTPVIFRYLSSDTSNTSMDSKTERILDLSETQDHSHKVANLTGVGGSLFQDITANAARVAQREDPETKVVAEREKDGMEGGKAEERQTDPEKYEEVLDSSSTSSFKSSNDYSDITEVSDLSFSKGKNGKSRSHFLDRLFRELRSFRKSLTRRRSQKKRGTHEERKEPNEFQDAVSVLNASVQQEKGAEGDERQKAEEAVTPKSVCIDELAIPAGHSMPRKIFKTSFRGKESVTELMIDLKDVSISEVSDISVEKMKLSTDHTKISIIISKQTNENSRRELCCTNRSTAHSDGSEMDREGQPKPPPEVSPHPLQKTNYLGWTKEEEEEDDDDYKSVDSSIHSKSFENIPERRVEEELRVVRDDLMEPKMSDKGYGRHRFDFYKKTEKATSSFDTLKVDGKEIFFSSKYDKELAPLKKALTDMQLRVRNIQRNSLCTSDEYYERALRMAKMSAGYCQSCQSRTLIPEDPLGLYQKLIPRASVRTPHAKQRKYYFRTTSSTNSSFYSIHSSNSDINDKFCQLNSSSSIVTNGLSRSRGSMWREAKTAPLPPLLGRTINL